MFGASTTGIDVVANIEGKMIVNDSCAVSICIEDLAPAGWVPPCYCLPINELRTRMNFR